MKGYENPKISVHAGLQIEYGMSESGHEQKSSVGLGMSVVGGEAEVEFGPLDVSL